MIKFFRRIRQNLINRERVGKYLLYAIGEILLVMIGILLALQVNNWNEARKSNIDKMELVKSLTEEFNILSTVLDNHLAFELRTADNIWDAVYMIEGENITIPMDSLKQRLKFVFLSSGIFMSLPKYSSALNTGKIALIEYDSFVKHMPAILQSIDEIHRLRDEFLEINYSGPLWDIKEEYWEVYKPFEKTDDSSPVEDIKYLQYISQPKVIAKIKGSVILRENIIRRMERIRDRLNIIVDNFESQLEIN